MTASWYVALRSNKLGKKPVALKLFGQDLVAWRDKSGKPVLIFYLLGKLDEDTCSTNARLARSVLFARPEDHPKIRARLEKFLHVPFRFEALGSQIIHYDGFEAGNP